MWLQPNLFYRVSRSPLLDAAKVFTDKAEMAKLLGLMQPLTPNVVVRAAGAWLQFLTQQPQAKGSKMGAVGYCTGAMVLRAAVHYPNRIVAGALAAWEPMHRTESAPSCAKNPLHTISVLPRPTTG
jgi:carboxymethylenebutenolidase